MHTHSTTRLSFTFVFLNLICCVCNFKYQSVYKFSIAVGRERERETGRTRYEIQYRVRVRETFLPSDADMSIELSKERWTSGSFCCCDDRLTLLSDFHVFLFAFRVVRAVR